MGKVLPLFICKIENGNLKKLVNKGFIGKYLNENGTTKSLHQYSSGRFFLGCYVVLDFKVLYAV